MSQSSVNPLGMADGLGRRKLGLRARVLLRLERWFPTAHIPKTTEAIAEHERTGASDSLGPLLRHYGSLEGKRVLDFGCGCGGQTAWLAKQAAEVVGCDVADHYIRQSRALAEKLAINNLSFELTDGRRLPFDDSSFDLVLSVDAFEHVSAPLENLSEIRRVLRPGGALITRFGPLFRGPRGYHLMAVTQVPFAHHFFGLRAVLELMEHKGITTSARSWEDLGMNRMTFAAFRKHLKNAGLAAKTLERIPVRRLKRAAGVPVLGELLTQSVFCHAVKP